MRPTFAPPLQSFSNSATATASSSSSSSSSSGDSHLRGDFGTGAAFGNSNHGPPPGYTFRVSVRGMSGSTIGGQPYFEVHEGNAQIIIANVCAILLEYQRMLVKSQNEV